MTTGSSGLCMAILLSGPSHLSSTGTFAIFSRTSKPSMIRPKTVYRPSRCGRGATQM